MKSKAHGPNEGPAVPAPIASQAALALASVAVKNDGATNSQLRDLPLSPGNPFDKILVE